MSCISLHHSRIPIAEPDANGFCMGLDQPFPSLREQSTKASSNRRGQAKQTLETAPIGPTDQFASHKSHTSRAVGLMGVFVLLGKRSSIRSVGDSEYLVQ